MTTPPGAGRTAPPANPWPALWAMVLGFFMILVDSTIVQVATPSIMRELDADVGQVIWVNSAYLLAYAVPLLITGRLGDRVGPRRLYLVGLTVFTLASLWCGLTGSVDGLILARVFQGLGASMMTPQTMSVITRTFPAARRGQAMALWGATAGAAVLVGPLLGGLLVGTLGWEWIFFVNIPVGVLSFVLAWHWVPRLETHSHSFDWVGVLLSALGMFLVVFGIQEGEAYDWGTITGQVTVWRLIGVGVVVLAGFVLWQARVRREPLVPLALFGERNFSLANLTITMVGFALTSFGFPFMLYAQGVRGWSPIQAAMLMIPMALLAGGLAPFVGRLIDHVHPRLLTCIGLVGSIAALTLLAWAIWTEAGVAPLVVAFVVMGVANAFVWSPLAATATRNLPMAQAGAGSGVYNTTRQVGAVLGSAAIAAVMQARLAVHLPGEIGDASGLGGLRLPADQHAGFAQAMGESMLLLVAVLVIGLVAALFFRPLEVTSPADRSGRR